MFLKSLILTGIAGEIRQIHFRKGVNLIVDGSENPRDSGNNVGKTTILRLIDFCLAGNGKNIYTDPEFQDQSPVKKFLEENEVLVTLLMTEDLDDPRAKNLMIERNFLPRNQKILRINGEDFTEADFKAELANHLFRHTADKPTIRQLVSKNIRDEKDRLNNILKVLHNTTSDVEYECLYQFWFGIQTDEGEAYRRDTEDKKKQESYRAKLRKEFDITGFGVLPEIETRIAELEQQVESLDLPEDYQKQIDAFDDLKAQLAQQSTRQSAVRLRIDLIEDSRKSLEADRSKVSADEIRQLYNEAKRLLPDLQKSFEQSVAFHNQMIENKLAFITRDLPKLRQEEQELIQSIHTLEVEAETYRDLLKKDTTLVALEKINAELRMLTERQAKLTEQKRIWTECLAELERIEERLARHATRTAGLNEQVDETLEIFNHYFKRISQNLYSTPYLLKRAAFNNKGEPAQYLKFEIVGITSNPGTGEKKGQITAFDLAYIEFAEKLDIPHLNFILHDQIENVDGRQIVTILEKLVPSINCQYIAPILKDKVPQEIDLARYAVVELSQSDKLFRFADMA